jgi:hypothetical protein
VFIGLSVSVLGTGSAFAATVPVTIDDSAPSLDKGDNGAFTVSLGFTNLTDNDIGLAPKPANAGDAGCNLSLDPSKLPRAEHTDVTVSVPAGCTVADDGINFTVATTTGSKSAATFPVTAAPKPADTPNWDVLWAFVIALVALAVVALIVQIVGPYGVATPLKYLDATWSFQDSWVANVTAVAALLTGIFGSTDVVTAFLGNEVDSATALATVGAAVAAAFIAAGPILLLATKNRADDAFTAGGLLGASVFTLAGAVGELAVVYTSGHELDLGGWEDWLWIPLVVASLLLALYAVRTTMATLRLGTTAPSEEDSDTIKAAKLIVAALAAKGEVSVDAVTSAFQQLPTVGRRRRRGALP